MKIGAISTATHSYGKLVLAATFAGTCAGSSTALAHGTGGHLLGTIADIHGNALLVRGEDKVEKAVVLNSKTRIRAGDRTADKSSLTPGARVYVDVEERDGSLIATLVRIAPNEESTP